MDEVVNLEAPPPPRKPLELFVLWTIIFISEVIYVLGFFLYFMKMKQWIVIPVTIGAIPLVVSLSLLIYFTVNYTLQKLYLMIQTFYFWVLFFVHLGYMVFYSFLIYEDNMIKLSLQPNLIIEFLFLTLASVTTYKYYKYKEDEEETNDQKLSRKITMFAVSMFIFVLSETLLSISFIIPNDLLDEFWKALFPITGALLLYFSVGFTINSIYTLNIEEKKYFKFLKFEILFYWIVLLVHILFFLFVVISTIVSKKPDFLMFGFYSIYLPLTIIFTFLFASITIYVTVKSIIYLKTTENEDEEEKDEREERDEREEIKESEENFQPIQDE